MEEQKGNVAPGQQNYPSESEPQGNPNRLSHDEIVKGAANEDQLDKLKDDAPERNEGKEVGAEPNVYKYERKTKDAE